MTKYDWLLFDLDNTILDFTKSSRVAFERVFQFLDSDKDIEELYNIYVKINYNIWQEFEAGLITSIDLKTKRWSKFCETIGLLHDPTVLNSIYFDGLKNHSFFVEGAKDLLEQLKEKYRMMVITNGLSEVQRTRIKDTNLELYFDHIIISDEIGFAKPDKHFFRHCEALMDYPMKDKVLVIGDTLLSDIKGGNDYGFHTCWFNYAHNHTVKAEANYIIVEIKQLLNCL